MPSIHWHSGHRERTENLSSTLWFKDVMTNNSTIHQTHTHKHTHTIIWICQTQYTMEKKKKTWQGLSGDFIGSPLQIKWRNTGVELDHKPLIYVSSSKNMAHWRWCLDKVDSAHFLLCSACPLPTQTWSVPSGQLSAFGGINKRLEIFFSFLVHFCSKHFLCPCCPSWHVPHTSVWHPSRTNTEVLYTHTHTHTYTHTDTLTGPIL